MKVILQQDVKGQGKKGDMIEVSEGYGRNFLLPRKLAVPATADAINTMNLKEKARKAEEARLKAEAQEIAGKLQNCPVKLSAKAGNGASEGHAKCSQNCAKNGEPIVFVEDIEKKIYKVVEGEDGMKPHLAKAAKKPQSAKKEAAPSKAEDKKKKSR